GIANPMTVFLTADSVLIRSLILTAGFTGISALIGIVVLIRRSMYALPIASYPLVFPFLYYVTHTSLRYRHPIDPVVLLLTAIAAQAVAQFIARTYWKKTSAESPTPSST